MAAAKVRDPHNVSHTLDAEETERLVARLESRGADAVFRSTFEPWLPRLAGCSRVLEVGCGTGVVTRAVAAVEGFSGRVVGVDQSAGLLAAAGRLSDGFPSVSYVRASAETLRQDLAAAGEARPFDAVIMHTLLSHVTEPQEVLRRAKDVCAAGAILVITDGDYSGLAYAHPDLGLGARVDRALVTATFAQPRVMRELPAVLPQCGWALSSHTVRCVSEVGSDASYWVSFAKAYLPRVKAAGLLSGEEADSWWEYQERAIDEGKFFAVCSYFTYFATAE
eukprot:TRINITY_DN19334_c0_g1_i1.p1 TRINITY_DN19334_c0_g1~~TRINITY_DN19334_c0_g1_i1.p1  ORF type:complete len:296 (+),score=106.42 TRINITY_DN19334_c0_g1_i1:52-888(+)